MASPISSPESKKVRDVNSLHPLALSPSNSKRKRPEEQVNSFAVNSLKQAKLCMSNEFHPLAPSSVSTLPKPVFFSLPLPVQEAFTPGQIGELQKEQRMRPPEAPKKKTSRSYLNKEQLNELDSYTNPEITTHLRELQGDGEYKTAWEVPENLPLVVNGISNKDILVLTFKLNKHNVDTHVIRKHLENTIEQYQLSKTSFGEDRCVIIHNADTALKDKYLIVEKIEHSLFDVFFELQNLVKKGALKCFENMEQLNQSLDENQTNAINLLSQLKWFFDKSIEANIDSDIHIGNFRLKKDESDNYKLILTDFRESIDKDDLICNKSTQFNEYVKKLGMIFSPDFLKSYFKNSLELLDRLNS